MAADVKRMRFFNGLFLKEEEFQLEQNYHKRMRRLHNRHLHGRGIVHGLNVNIGNQNDEILVTEGMALDRFFDNEFSEYSSREIVIAQNREVDLSIYAANDEVWVWVSYTEEPADVVSDRGGPDPIHTLESGIINHSTTRPPDEDLNIILAKVVINPDDTIDANSIKFEDNGLPIRISSGFSGDRIEVETVAMRDPAIPENWAFLDGQLFPNGDIGMNVVSERTRMTGAVDVDGVLTAEVEMEAKGKVTARQDVEVEGNLLARQDITVDGTLMLNSALTGTVHQGLDMSNVDLSQSNVIFLDYLDVGTATSATITLNNGVPGTVYYIYVRSNGTPYTISNVNWPSSITPIPSPSGKRDLYSVLCVGANDFLGTFAFNYD